MRQFLFSLFILSSLFAHANFRNSSQNETSTLILSSANLQFEISLVGKFVGKVEVILVNGEKVSLPIKHREPYRDGGSVDIHFTDGALLHLPINRKQQARYRDRSFNRTSLDISESAKDAAKGQGLALDLSRKFDRYIIAVSEVDKTKLVIGYPVAQKEHNGPTIVLQIGDQKAAEYKIVSTENYRGSGEMVTLSNGYKVFVPSKGFINGVRIFTAEEEWVNDLEVVGTKDAQAWERDGVAVDYAAQGFNVGGSGCLRLY